MEKNCKNCKHLEIDEDGLWSCLTDACIEGVWERFEPLEACEHCKPVTHPEVSAAIYDDYDMVLRLDTAFDRSVVLIERDDIVREIPINFCPMCGRSLRDE